jgi:hypothetical protein
LNKLCLTVTRESGVLLITKVIREKTLINNGSLGVYNKVLELEKYSELVKRKLIYYLARFVTRIKFIL